MLAALDLGYETVVQGESDTDAGGNARPTSQRGRTSRATKAATAQEIADAVSNFGKAMRTKREQGELSATDLLRLRALLMVVCWAALPCSATVGRPSDLQVLSMTGTEPTWWRTVGRVLYALFRPTDSALELSLTDEHDQVPPDVLECWATCDWCLQVCLAAPVAESARQQIRRHIGPLAERVYRLTGTVRETMDRIPDARPTARTFADPPVTAAMPSSSARVSMESTLKV